MPIPAPPLRDILVLLPEMLLTLAACVVLLVDIGTQRQYKQRLGWGCIGVVLVAFLVMALLPATGGPVFAGMFIADSYAAFFKVLFLLAVILTVLVSLRYLDDEATHYG